MVILSDAVSYFRSLRERPRVQPTPAQGRGKMANDSTRNATGRELVAKIVESYVRHHRLPVDEMPTLIASVHRSLSGLGETRAVAPQTPAVPVRRSFGRDYVVCLECGFRGRILRSHLRIAHGLTPEKYRARWNLPSTHPITAPGYSVARSTIAKDSGFGRRAVPPAEPAAAPKRRGRSRAAARS
jgi:predicted transcriptional regulator